MNELRWIWDIVKTILNQWIINLGLDNQRQNRQNKINKILDFMDTIFTLSFMCYSEEENVHVPMLV